ncbi:hypothetical protein K469DRAFT_592708 [Zopfia rhizophila CBS 207.26]|uniref:Rhodopsin domain-containing protein n=1 Tax=Zopfia rhizophila CBS 207.26 TaxID=1314779 RepID=A0A6A6DQF2_9PEZI|nr:hypothetical protein K469DRAFT_592708 [Zopfia rhizophila CBS 207.26]
MPPTEKGRNLNVWVIIFTILTLSTIVLRFCALRIVRRKLRVDDVLVLIAFGSLLGMQGAFWWTIPHNLGASVLEIDPHDASIQHRAQYSTGVTWTVATCSCKVAVLWMYLSLFPLGRPRYAVYTVMGLTVAYAIAFMPIFLTACNPPSAQWALDPIVQLAKCRPIQRQEFASVSINMALDLAVVLLPLPQVWGLRMPVKKKLFVSGMFSVGLLVVGIMAWRIQTTVESMKSIEWSYFLVTIALQSFLEVWLGLMAANLPVMAPVFTKVITPAVKRSFKSWSSSDASSNLKRLTRTFGGGSSGKKSSGGYPLSDYSMDLPMVPVPCNHRNEMGHHSSDERSDHSELGIWREVEVHVDSTKSTQKDAYNVV